MKILVLSLRLPHAQLTSGHLIVYQRLVRLIERGHRVGLAVFAHPGDDPHLCRMRPLLVELETVPLPAKTVSLLTPRPLPFALYRSPAMRRCVGDMVQRSNYDVVLAEYSVMGQFLTANPFLPAVRKVISVHHSYSVVREKSLRVRGGWVRKLKARLALNKLVRYEFNLYRRADHVLVLTPEERFQMSRHAPDLHMTVIPSGVDTLYFQPVESAAHEKALVFTAQYKDDANRDAVLWFLKEVWPGLRRLHPDLLFYIVGPGAPPGIREMAQKDPGLRVTGEVTDIRPYLARAMVYVCPVRLGSGMRNKILEAMAAGLPVVATTQSAAGIPIQIGTNGFLADTPQVMQENIDLLLTDPALRLAVSTQARDMVIHRFSWDRAMTQLEETLAEVIAPR